MVLTLSLEIVRVQMYGQDRNQKHSELVTNWTLQVKKHGASIRASENLKLLVKVKITSI